MKVREMFQTTCNAFHSQIGRKPNHCTIALGLARKAAAEHKAERRFPDSVPGMFQSWNPTMTFLVDAAAPPDTLYVTLVEPIAGAPTSEGRER